MIATPARTRAGQEAKALVMLLGVGLDADGGPLLEKEMRWSLARDLLGLSPAEAGTPAAARLAPYHLAAFYAVGALEHRMAHAADPAEAAEALARFKRLVPAHRRAMAALRGEGAPS